MSMMSRRISAAVDGRPGGRVRWVQCRAMRRRCQRISVVGGDDPADTSWAGERSCDRAEKRSVIVGQLRLFGLGAQDGELVA
jgi:hypothetical protein